jgi:hypothetical protein
MFFKVSTNWTSHSLFVIFVFEQKYQLKQSALKQWRNWTDLKVGISFIVIASVVLFLLFSFDLPPRGDNSNLDP